MQITTEPQKESFTNEMQILNDLFQQSFLKTKYSSNFKFDNDQQLNASLYDDAKLWSSNANPNNTNLQKKSAILIILEFKEKNNIDSKQLNILLSKLLEFVAKDSIDNDSLKAWSMFITRFSNNKFSFLDKNLQDLLTTINKKFSYISLLLGLDEQLELLLNKIVSLNNNVSKAIATCVPVPNLDETVRLNSLLELCVETLKTIRVNLQNTELAHAKCFSSSFSIFSNMLIYIAEQMLSDLMQLSKKSQSACNRGSIDQEKKKKTNLLDTKNQEARLTKARNSSDNVFEIYKLYTTEYSGLSDCITKTKSVLGNFHINKEIANQLLTQHLEPIFALYKSVKEVFGSKFSLDFTADEEIKKFLNPTAISVNDFKIAKNRKENLLDAKKIKLGNFYKTISTVTNMFVLKDGNYIICNFADKSSSVLKGIFNKSSQYKIILYKNSCKSYEELFSTDNKKIQTAVFGNNFLVMAHENKIDFLNLSDKKFVKTKNFPENISGIFTVTDSKLLIGLVSGNLILLDLVSDKQAKVQLQNKNINLIAYIEEDKIAMSFGDGSIKLVNFETGECLKENNTIFNDRELTAMKYIKPSTIYCGFDNGEMAIWMTNVNQFSLMSQNAHSQKITSIEHRAGLIYTSSLDKTVKVWSRSNFELLNVVSYKEPILKLNIVDEDFVCLLFSGMIHRGPLKELLPSTELKKSASVPNFMTM